MTSIRQSGFTLIELMFVIAVVGVLAAAALPAFNDMVRNNQVATASNDFLASLHIARSEAITRNMPVSVCRANAALTACESTGGSWRNGTLAFADTDGDGVLDTGEEILITGEQMGGRLEMYSTEFGRVITFRSNGRVNLPTGTDVGQWRLCEPGSAGVISGILVNRTGRPRTGTVTGSCPT